MLACAAWAVVLVDTQGAVLSIVMGGVVGHKTAPCAEVAAFLWIVERGCGHVPLVTDCEHICRGAASSGPERRLLLEVPIGDMWALVGVPPAVTVGVSPFRRPHVGAVANWTASELRVPAHERAAFARVGRRA